jgi:hypothetical protein
MSKPFPLDLFPDQLFPDVKLKKVQLTSTELAITVSESQWGIQSDIIFFYGSGTMTFGYTGRTGIRRRGVRGNDWREITTPEILNSVAAFEMVTRTDSGWTFRFRAARADDSAEDIVEVVLQEVTEVSWSGEGANLEDDD